MISTEQYNLKIGTRLQLTISVIFNAFWLVMTMITSSLLSTNGHLHRGHHIYNSTPDGAVFSSSVFQWIWEWFQFCQSSSSFLSELYSLGTFLSSLSYWLSSTFNPHPSITLILVNLLSFFIALFLSPPVSNLLSHQIKSHSNQTKNTNIG